MKRINYMIFTFTVFIMLFSVNILTADDSAIQSSENNAVIFKVMLIVLTIWIALSIYIFYLYRKVKRLEKKLDEK
jgi:CcmD family protein